MSLLVLFLVDMDYTQLLRTYIVSVNWLANSQNSCSSKKLLIWFSIVYEGCLSCGTLLHLMSEGLLFGKTTSLFDVDGNLTTRAGKLECFNYTCIQSTW